MKQIAFFSVVFSFLLAGGCNERKQRQSSRPNIVFILADDLGYGDLGCYGQQRIQTPHIDRLASEGMRFTQFYAGASVCAPSRSVLLTGQHSGHTFIRDNKRVGSEGQYPLADSVYTFAQLLQDVGYTTGAFGKWGLGMVGTSGAPNQNGFDTFFGYNCQFLAHRYYPTHLWYNDEKILLEGNDWVNKVTYAPEVIHQQALKFIEDNRNNPFFLYIPTVLPHAELLGPEDEHFRKYENSFTETPYIGTDYDVEKYVGGYASCSKPRATFAAMVSRMDAHVGEILAKLDKLGLKENTIVIFSSDNGPHKEGGADPVFFNSSGGLRGHKRDLYEGGIRVPFIVSWPGKVRPQTQNDFVGAFWDVMPTVAEIAETQEPRYTDGISILPTLLGKDEQQPQHEFLYWEFHAAGGRQAVRKGKWKAVRLQAKDKGKATIKLFDLDNDPAETTNLVKDYPDIVLQLTAFMNKAHQESEVFPFFQGNSHEMQYLQ